MPKFEFTPEQIGQIFGDLLVSGKVKKELDEAFREALEKMAKDNTLKHAINEAVRGVVKEMARTHLANVIGQSVRESVVEHLRL